MESSIWLLLLRAGYARPGGSLREDPYSKQTRVCYRTVYSSHKLADKVISLHSSFAEKNLVPVQSGERED